MYVATSSQMKKYDTRLLKEGYTIEELVDKASDCIIPHCKNYDTVAIVCGIGNNGADGISLAIKLLALHKKVQVYIVGDYSRASKAAMYYRDMAIGLGVTITSVMPEVIADMKKNLSMVEIIIDAIFGFGLHSNPKGIVANVVQCINNIGHNNVMSLDIPTGLQCDTGEAYEHVIYATRTITLTAHKQGFLNPESKKYTGDVIVEVLTTKDFRKEQGFAKIWKEDTMCSLIKKRDHYGHKGIYGKVLHVTGSESYKGASLLSAKAAVYSGSGVVSVYSTQEVIRNLALFVPEAVSLIRGEKLDVTICNRFDAILVGCGLGLLKSSYTYVKELLANASVPLVIDADALTIVAEHKEALRAYQKPVILTPHIGEFRRFVPELNEKDMVDTARAFAKEYGVILVLKGPHTLLTDGIRVYRNGTGNPSMATAGMGDVLAGMISSFVGQQYEPMEAALLATYIHGASGDILSKNYYTVIPSKLIDEIPKVMQEMKKRTVK